MVKGNEKKKKAAKVDNVAGIPKVGDTAWTYHNGKKGWKVEITEIMPSSAYMVKYKSLRYDDSCFECKGSDLKFEQVTASNTEENEGDSDGLAVEKIRGLTIRGPDLAYCLAAGLKNVENRCIYLPVPCACCNAPAMCLLICFANRNTWWKPGLYAIHAGINKVPDRKVSAAEIPIGELVELPKDLGTGLIYGVVRIKGNDIKEHEERLIEMDNPWAIQGQR